MNDSVMAKVSRIKAAGPLTTARPVATGFNGDRRQAMLGLRADAVRGVRPGAEPGEPKSCGGQLGAGSVDAARAACIEAARKKGDQPIETENVRVLGEGRYEMSVRNKGTLGSSVTTCNLR